MTHFRISEAADLLAVSDDTVRRWIVERILPVELDASGRQVIPGAALAAHLKSQAHTPADGPVRHSARNRFTGLVTNVDIDGLVAQVEVQAGPHRIVSLMTAEAARELRLAVGSRATAVVKATMVTIETPEGHP